MNIAQVDSAISKASRLMNEDFMRRVDNVEAMRKGKPIKGVNDLSILEQKAFGYSGGYSQQPKQTQENIAPRQFSNSALKESFAQTPPISGNNFPGAESIGVTQTGYQPGASLLANQGSAPQHFVQQPQQVYQPQYQPQGGGINYDMIKYFISEAIKENMVAIKESILTEGTVAGIRMPGSNKIQFLDSKGNVYEGQLVLKKKKR